MSIITEHINLAGASKAEAFYNFINAHKGTLLDTVTYDSETGKITGTKGTRTVFDWTPSDIVTTGRGWTCNIYGNTIETVKSVTFSDFVGSTAITLLAATSNGIFIADTPSGGTNVSRYIIAITTTNYGETVGVIGTGGTTITSEGSIRTVTALCETDSVVNDYKYASVSRTFTQIMPVPTSCEASYVTYCEHFYALTCKQMTTEGIITMGNKTMVTDGFLALAD